MFCLFFFFLINLNSVVFSPFFPHILDAWSKRHHPNMHFMFYEDMKKVNQFKTRRTRKFQNDVVRLTLRQDFRGEIEKVATSLEKSLSDEQLGKLTEHLKFENFQKNESGQKMGAMNEDGRLIRNGRFFIIT